MRAPATPGQSTHWFSRAILFVLMLIAGAGVPLYAQPVAPALLLANEFRAGLEVSQYLVSEKFDGVRATWDGKT